MSITNRAKSTVASLGLATFGQGMNFLAMILPVLANEAGQLAYLVFPLAVAAIIHRLGFWGFHVRYIAVPETERTFSLVVSFLSLLILSLAIGLIGLALVPFWKVGAGMLTVIAALTLSHGLYFMGTTLLIADSRQKEYGVARLAYGFLNFGLTALVVFIFPFKQGLVVTAFLITALTGVWMIWAAKINFSSKVRTHLGDFFSRKTWNYIRESLEMLSSVFISDLGVQALGFITPLMGPLNELWAVVLRLSWGFGTVGQQVVAPFFEMRVSEEVRRDGLLSAQQWVRKSQFVSLVFSAVVTVVQTVIILVIYRDIDARWVYVSAIYTFFSLASVLCLKTPYFVGKDRLLVAWSVLRLIFCLPLFLLHNEVLLIAVVIMQVVTGLVYMVIVFRPVEPRVNSHIERPPAGI